jgi:hypothetical protein
VLPDRLAVRAGGFFETNGQQAQYQNIDFMGAQRVGLMLGGTYRVHLNEAKKNALEFMLGFGHVFVSDQTYNNPNATNGLQGLVGTACDSTTGQKPVAGGYCQNPDGSQGTQKYRTPWPINLGTITNSFTMINVGASYKF